MSSPDLQPSDLTKLTENGNFKRNVMDFFRLYPSNDWSRRAKGGKKYEPLCFLNNDIQSLMLQWDGTENWTSIEK
ncbi:hypothetical protein CEXT_79591 [Caerostris extrusa]|uniref:Uncharacterized protein n=1 Tax=Caerostris extrusa TaxID=172846 RepID=A0AAV4XML5_CAEEX|nr:hypothetical protein CEXT_79591 [Caerostris extrusa]